MSSRIIGYLAMLCN